MTLKKSLRITLGILIIIAISLIIECFFINFKYWTLPKSKRGMTEISLQDLEFSNASYSNGTITVNDKNSFFKIKSKEYISYLTVISYNPKLKGFYMYVDDNKHHVNPAKRFEVNMNYKSFSSIAANGNMENIKFYFEAVDNKYPIDVSFNKIFIDNRFYPNLMRAALIAICLILVAYIVLYRNIAFKKLHITFLVICILFGTYIAILKPFKFSWDESEHFIKSYYLSYGKFDLIEKPPIKLPKNFVDFMENPVPQTFREKVAYTKQFSTKEYPIKEYVNSTAKNYTSVTYLPSALGIWSSRSLSIPFIYTMFFGRIFSLIAYAALCAFAIKNAKIGKRLIFIIALLPTSVLLGASYSADPLTTAYALLCTVQFINMICVPDKSINYKKMGLLTILTILLIAAKPTYAPFALFLLAIPKTKFKDEKQSKFFKVGAFISCVVASIFIVMYTLRFKEPAWPIPGVNQKEQIRFIIENPFMYLMRFIKAIFENALIYLQGSSIDLAYSKSIDLFWLLLIFILILVITLVDYEEQCINLKWLQRLTLFLVVFCSWGLVYTSLYLSFTPVSELRADGVQPRYITPLLFPLTLLFKNNNIKFESKQKDFKLNRLIIISMIILLLVTSKFLLIKHSM